MCLALRSLCISELLMIGKGGWLNFHHVHISSRNFVQTYKSTFFFDGVLNPLFVIEGDNMNTNRFGEK